MAWTRVKLPEILFFQEGPGVRNTQFTEAGIKLLNVGNINNGKIDLNKTKIYISESEAYGKYRHFLVDEGDLIIASSGIVVDNFHNKIAFVKKEHLPLCMNTSTIRFKTLEKKKVDISFFKFFLQSVLFKKQISKLITGSAQLNFGPSHLKQIEVPLPNLGTQERIAKILDEADAIRRVNIKILEKYDELLHASFLQFFGNSKGLNKRFPSKKLFEVAEVVSGIAKNTRGVKDDFVEVPYMRVANVQDGHINLNDVKTIKVSKPDIEKYLLKKNDILLTEGGDPDKLGRGAVWHDEISPCIHQNHIFRVRPDSTLLNALYLSFHIGSPYGKAYFLKAAKQTTGIASINMNQLKGFDVIMPPLSLQNKFSEVVIRIEEQKALAKLQQIQSEALFQSLLQKAFKGEL